MVTYALAYYDSDLNKAMNVLRHKVGSSLACTVRLGWKGLTITNALAY
jgi:hypothetical protein